MAQTTRISAYALLVEDARILLCRLSPGIVSDGQPWTLPGGGIDFGEHPRGAAIREVFEECGLDITIDGAPHVDSEVFQDFEPRMHILRLIYQGRVIGGELRNEVEGSTDRCEWFTREEALALPLVSLAKLGIELAFPGPRASSPHAT